jgi:hypothetical protein
MTNRKVTNSNPSSFSKETLKAIAFWFGNSPDDFCGLTKSGLISLVVANREDEGRTKTWKQIANEAIKGKLKMDRQEENFKKSSGYISIILQDFNFVSDINQAVKMGAKFFIEVNSHSDDVVILGFSKKVSDSVANRVYEYETMIKY